MAAGKAKLRSRDLKLVAQIVQRGVTASLQESLPCRNRVGYKAVRRKEVTQPGMPEFHESDPFVPVPFSLPQSEKNRLDQRIANWVWI